MSIIRKLNTPFFLTGGTALSRHYYNHRYSDDLDLFVLSDIEYHNCIVCKMVSHIRRTLLRNLRSDFTTKSSLVKRGFRWVNIKDKIRSQISHRVFRMWKTILENVYI